MGSHVSRAHGILCWGKRRIPCRTKPSQPSIALPFTSSRTGRTSHLHSSSLFTLDICVTCPCTGGQGQLGKRNAYSQHCRIRLENLLPFQSYPHTTTVFVLVSITSFLRSLGDKPHLVRHSGSRTKHSLSRRHNMLTDKADAASSQPLLCPRAMMVWTASLAASDMSSCRAAPPNLTESTW
jgi:hypothetical protein